LRSLME